jgi:hypothetical protein
MALTNLEKVSGYRDVIERAYIYSPYMKIMRTIVSDTFQTKGFFSTV